MTTDGVAGPALPEGGRVDIGRRATRGFAWGLAAFGGNRLLVFASTLVLARLLAPEDFGVVAAGLTVVLYLEVLLDLGLGAALVYEQEVGITRRVQTAVTVTILAAALLTALGMVLAPLIAAFFRVPDETSLFRALFVSLLLRGLAQVPDALLKRDLRFASRSAVEITRGVVRLAVSVGLAFAGAGAWAIVGGLLASEFVGAVLLWTLVRFRPDLSMDRSALRMLLGFGGNVLALKLLDAVAADADYLVVGRELGLGALGQYTVAYRLPELLLLNVLWVFSSVAFPIYSSVRKDRPSDFGGAVLRALRLVTLYSFPVAVALALLSRDAVAVLFGSAWAPAAAPMALLALTAVPTSLGYASGDVFPAIGRPGLLLALNVPMSVVLVGALVVAAPYGITAVAAVHLAVSAVYGLARLLLAGRVVGTTVGQALVAMRPAVTVVAGVLVVAGPPRLLLDSGPVTLVVLCAAVVTGGTLGLLVGGRDTVGEVVGVLRSRGRQ